jgi:tyrosyl-tRNA synthetase
MMSKDSVKKRLNGEGREGMSFTEFSYQLVQAYDFYYLYTHENCKLQMGGSDQWGNITTGTELIRRKAGGEAFAMTCPLITKADGGKFGKTEKGNVWLDAAYTSPYSFYQFWLNVSDKDAEKYVKIFTMLSREEIDEAIKEHSMAPEKRVLQKILAREITVMVHGVSEYENAVTASGMLFGKSTSQILRKLDERTFLSVFEGVPQFQLDKSKLGAGILEMLAVETSVFPSKGECRKMIQANGLSINKDKYTDVNGILDSSFLINGKYILVQKGRKNYFILKFI